MARQCTLIAVGNAVVAVSKVEGREMYGDLINSILLAQLVANKKIKNKTADQWYDAYVSVLDDFWIRNLKFRLDLSLGSNPDASPLEWVVAAMQGSGAQDQAFDNFLRYAARMPRSVPALNVLCDNAQEYSGEEDVSPRPPLKSVRLLAILAQNPTSFTSVYVDFQTRQELTPNPWSQRLKVEEMQGPVCVRYARANLSETLYMLARETLALKIRDRLPEHVTTLVKTADIAF